MKVDFQVVTNDLKSKMEIFKTEFPEFMDDFKKLEGEKSGCGSCLQGLVAKIMAHKDAISKLKLIYGSYAEIDTKMPVYTEKREVYHIPLEEYDAWFNVFSDSQTKQIRMYSTHYNPQKHCITASVVYFLKS